MSNRFLKLRYYYREISITELVIFLHQNSERDHRT